MVLMVFTIVWEVNPIEGSVTSDILKTSWGRPIWIVLMVTCTPGLVVGYLLGAGVWFGAAFILRVNPSEDSGMVVLCCVIVIVQGLLYFGIGKLISIFVRTLKGALR